MNELIYEKETDSQTQRINLQLPGGRLRGKDSQGVWNGHVHTDIFKMYNQQWPIVQHRELCSILYNNLNGKII